MNVHVSERIPWQDGEGVRKVLNEREHAFRSCGHTVARLTYFSSLACPKLAPVERVCGCAEDEEALGTSGPKPAPSVAMLPPWVGTRTVISRRRSKNGLQAVGLLVPPDIGGPHSTNAAAVLL